MKEIATALAAWLLVAPAGFCGSVATGLETGGDLSVRVVVEPLSPEASGIGLDRDALQLRVEQRLRYAGLVPLDDAAWRRRPDAPRLSVTVEVNGELFGGEVKFERLVVPSGGNAASRVMVVAWRRVIPQGRVQQLTLVATKFPSWRWRSHEPGSRTGHLAYITNAVLETVDAFCTDFLAANGR